MTLSANVVEEVENGCFEVMTSVSEEVVVGIVESNSAIFGVFDGIVEFEGCDGVVVTFVERSRAKVCCVEEESGFDGFPKLVVEGGVLVVVVVVVSLDFLKVVCKSFCFG